MSFNFHVKENMWRSDEQRSKIGLTGENVACSFLKGKGHNILDRNYRKKWGEIDVISELKGVLHFVEVKAGSHETRNDVSRETETWNMAEKVHPRKLKKMARTIETYMAERHVPHETAWQIDVITVSLEENAKKARVRYIPNIVL